MNFTQRLFRWCMVGAALIIAGVAIYFFLAYFAASVSWATGGVNFSYQQSVRSMWLGFCAQLGLLAAVLLYAAARPRGISRQVVTVLALMPMMSTVMLFWFAANRLGGVFLGVAALLMLVAALAWPARVDVAVEPVSAQAPGSPLP